MPKNVRKKPKHKPPAPWALALVSISVAMLAGVFALILSVRELPVYQQPTAAPLNESTPDPSPEKTATPAVATTMPAVLKHSPSPAPAVTAHPSADPTPSSNPTKKPMPSATAEQSAAPARAPAAQAVPDPTQVTERSMTIQALLGRMGDRPTDAYGSLGVVKRGDAAYYVWAGGLYLYDGKTTERILENASCGWMHVDAGGDLWFSIRGGSGIAVDRVQEWDHIYEYDRINKTFRLMLSEGRSCRFSDDYGMAMAGPLFFYIQDGVLSAMDTQSGAVTRYGAAHPDAFVRAAGAGAVYYRNAGGAYVLLEDPYGAGRKETVLALSGYPSGEFDCAPYLLSGSSLYRFRKTGYEAVCGVGKAPAGPLAGGAAVETAGGVAVPFGEAAAVDVFDLGTKVWRRLGDPAAEGAFCCEAGGLFWFVRWKPAALVAVNAGGSCEYRLSDAMAGCTYVGDAGGMLFLSEYDLYYHFTHVFMADTGQLYEIQFPPLPGEEPGR